MQRTLRIHTIFCFGFFHLTPAWISETNCQKMDTVKNELPKENLINDMLIDDILRIIFDRHFDVRNRLQLRSVCSKWKQIIEPLFATKHAIRLSESKANFQSRQIQLAEMPPFEADLHIDNITHMPLSSAQSLAELLTTAKKFAFEYTSEYSLIDVSPFFETMTTLTTVILYRLPHNQRTHQKILLSLNNLSCLTHLHLCNMHEIQIPDNMTIFAQLEIFKLDYCNYNCFSSLANQLGTSLKRLELLRTDFNSEYLTQKRYPALKHLKLQETRSELFDEKILQLVPQLSKNLPLLESLYLRVSERYTFIDAMMSLSQMKHLKELSLLHIGEDLLQMPAKPLPSFPALKSLDLQFSIWNPSNESFLLDAIVIMCPLLTNLNLYDARLQTINKEKFKSCADFKEIVTISPEYIEDRQRFESVKIVHKLKD